MLGSRLGLHFAMILSSISGWKMRIQKAECVRHLDHAHPSLALLLNDLITQRLHSRPMHLRPEMMFGMEAIVEPRPVIELAIGAHAPGNRFVGIAPVMPIVAVQIREAVAKIPKWQKERDVMPVEYTEDHKSRDEAHQLEHSPKRLARVLALQLLENSLGVLTKETPECVFQRMLRFT